MPTVSEWLYCPYELDRLKQPAQADALDARIAARDTRDDPLSLSGLECLQQTCGQLQRRPVLLVDNLDFLLERIDKDGRKRKNPLSPAYWSLREALSTAQAPLVIGASVRLSEPFTDYDKAFYDFFLPRPSAGSPVPRSSRCSNTWPR